MLSPSLSLSLSPSDAYKYFVCVNFIVVFLVVVVAVVDGFAQFSSLFSSVQSFNYIKHCRIRIR